MSSATGLPPIVPTARAGSFSGSPAQGREMEEVEMDEKQIVLLMAATIFANQHKPANEVGKPDLGYRRAIRDAQGLYAELVAAEAGKP